MINKRGVTFANILLISFLLLFVFVFGFIFVMTGGTLNYVADQIIPEISGLGDVGGTNFTEISDMTLTPLAQILNSFDWLIGVGMIMTLLTMLALSTTFRANNNYWLISAFVLISLLSLIVSIFLSNAYSEFYYYGDDFAGRLETQTIASYLILYSPLIFTIIIFICGIIMFTGREEGFV